MAPTVVTNENLSALVYEVEPGIQYKFTDDCTRTLKAPFIDTERAYSKLMAKENVQVVDTESESYWVNVRIEALMAITDGDDLPESGWSTDMLNRVIADFFRYRYAKAAPQIPLLASTNATQQ